GTSSRLARSPVAPKITIAQGGASGALSSSTAFRALGWFFCSGTATPLSLLGFLDVAAELVAHGRKQPVRKVRISARAEALVERRRQHVSRHTLVDGGLDGPAPFAGVRDAAGEAGEVRILHQCRRR